MGKSDFNVVGVLLWSVLGAFIGVAFANFSAMFSLSYTYMALLLGGFSTGLTVILVKYRQTQRNHFLIAVSILLVLSFASALPFYAPTIPLLSLMGPVVFGALMGIILLIVFLLFVRIHEKQESRD